MSHGQPTRFSPERVRRIVDAVREGTPYTELARIHGCGHVKIARIVAANAPELVKRATRSA
jgi:transposase-like protein